MSDATDEYGCRPTDPDWMRQVAKDNNQPGVNVRWERTVKVHDDWYKPTPRVAESLDDLRAGAVVLMLDAESPMKSWTEKVLIGPENAGQDDWEPHLSSGHIVILADPPAPPAPEEGIKCPTCGVARGWNTDGHLTRGIWTLNCSQCGSFQVEIEDTSVPAPHAEAEAGSDWIYGKDAACRFIARTAWPWEATENRDGWAPRIGNEPDFGQKELELAYRRLDAAAEALGLRGRGDRG